MYLEHQHFVINDKIFWGQDRLDFALDEYNK